MLEARDDLCWLNEVKVQCVFATRLQAAQLEKSDWLESAT